MTTITCERCKGAGSYVGLGCHGDGKGCGAVTLTCDRCLGSGRLDAARLELLAVAEELRALRIGARMGYREAATILEMSVVDVANAERGRTDPRPVLALLRERAAARLAGGPVSVQASFDAAVMGAVRLPHGARQ